MQKHAEKVCKEMNETLGKELNASQIGFVVMTPDGDVKAMVGGVDYRKKQYNHVTQAERQPGSAFKSFVYLAALESGMTPETMIEDTPVQIGNWHPGNYKYEAQGEITLLEGMAKSVNAVVVRLGIAVGAHKIIEVARRLGITSKMTPDLSITLGSMETTLLQLTSAFASYANKGYAVWPHGILEIRSKAGDVLYKPDNGQPHQIIQPEHLAGMRQMLNAVVTQGTGRAAALAVGGKTGSNQDKDAWFIGYTDSLVAGVWVGNDDNKPMKKISVGGRMPARTWQAFFAGLKDVNYKKSTNDLDAILDSVVTPPENLPTGQLKAPENAVKAPAEPTEKELSFDNIEDMIDAFASSDGEKAQ
jgi:penicillin-binding protein 1A